MKKDSQKTKKKSLKREILSDVIFLLVVLFVVRFMVKFICQPTVVDGRSMETTLSDRDRLMVDKVSYNFTDPKRFEIVIFPQGEKHYVKRIIGLPNETIQIKDGYVYLDGVLLEEDVFGNEPMRSARLAEELIVLGADEYFVLGDNRNNSTDSRDIGVVKREKILGKAFWRIWPLNKLGLIK
jgi:signal peptidase I, bacterial type